MADALLRDSYMLTQHDGPGTAAELLGIDAAAIHKAVVSAPSLTSLSDESLQFLGVGDGAAFGGRPVAFNALV